MNLYIVTLAREGDRQSHHWDRYLIANERPSYDVLMGIISEYHPGKGGHKIVSISNIGLAQAHILPGVLLCEDGVAG